MGRTHQPTYPKTQKTQTPPSASQNPSMAFLAGLAALLAALLAAAFRRIRRHPTPAPAAGSSTRTPTTAAAGSGALVRGARRAGAPPGPPLRRLHRRRRRLPRRPRRPRARPLRGPPPPPAAGSVSIPSFLCPPIDRAFRKMCPFLPENWISVLAARLSAN